MAGYVIGSKAHYEFLKRQLLNISEKLEYADVNLDEKAKLYLKQVDFVEQMEKHFPDGKPK